jgi:hypothetical protein
MLELYAFTVFAFYNYLLLINTNNVKTSPNLHLMLHYSHAFTSPEHSQHFLGMFERITGRFLAFSVSTVGQNRAEYSLFEVLHPLPHPTISCYLNTTAIATSLPSLLIFLLSVVQDLPISAGGGGGGRL